MSCSDLRDLHARVVVDDMSLLADVAAGVFGNALEEELRDDHGLTLGHRPQSVAISTVGGWLACRSAGQYSTRYGKIEDMVVGLEVALADGRIVRTGGHARAATGPDLTQLFVGSEGTLGVVGKECRVAGAEVLGTEPVDRWMAHRDGVVDVDALARQGIVGDTMEVAARWSALGPLYEDLRTALTEVAGTVWASGHLSHAYGDGACLYLTFAGQGEVEWYVRAWDAAAAVVLRHGGALSHHHGIGLAKARFLPAALGAAHGVLADIKATLDPAGVLNPGKLGLPDPFGDPGWPAP